MSRRTPKDADSPTGLDGFPLILRLDDVLALTRRGKSTVLREIGNDTFRPRPFDSHPYRWYRADWEEVLRDPSAPERIGCMETQARARSSPDGQAPLSPPVVTGEQWELREHGGVNGHVQPSP